MRRLSFILFLFFSQLVFSQDSLSLDTNQFKIKVPKNQLKLLYSLLGQDGEHSAVTGGQGTEDLTVHSARVIYIKKTENNNKWKHNVGVDNITSASTDQIDLIESTASYKDYRVSGKSGFELELKKDTSAVGLFVGGSLESDYVSRSIGMNYFKKNKYNGLYQSQFSFFWDDLRWGLVTSGVFDLYKMVYPIELRGKDWFNTHNRNTYTWSNKWSFAANKRSKLGFFADITFQEGILSTPFHRVFLEDNSVGVELLPQKRWRLPVAVQYNYFLGGGIVLRNYFRYYWDSFFLNAYTYSLQVPIKLNYSTWLKPFARIYYQSGIPYFQPYQEHLNSAQFRTSDYDLSQFSSLNLGLTLKLKKKAGWKFLNGYEFSVEYYKRSDGLYFWQTSAMADFLF